MKSLITGLLIVTCVSLKAQSKLYPKNEIPQNEGLSAFVADLRTIIEKEDTTSLFKYLDEDILNGFGGSGGPEEFKQYWNLPKGTPKLWTTLTELLDLGGTLNKESGEVVGATWPYTFTLFPDELDAYNYWIVTGSGVALRKKPASDAEIITRLSYDILPFDYEMTYENEENRLEDGDIESVKWIALKYKDSIGYVSAKYVRSPIDYRMSVLNVDGKWKIVVLVAGD